MLLVRRMGVHSRMVFITKCLLWTHSCFCSHDVALHSLSLFAISLYTHRYSPRLTTVGFCRWSLITSQSVCFPAHPYFRLLVRTLSIAPPKPVYHHYMRILFLCLSPTVPLFLSYCPTILLLLFILCISSCSRSCSSQHDSITILPFSLLFLPLLCVSASSPPHFSVSFSLHPFT